VQGEIHSRVNADSFPSTHTSGPGLRRRTRVTRYGASSADTASARNSARPRVPCVRAFRANPRRGCPGGADAICATWLRPEHGNTVTFPLASQRASVRQV